MFKLKRLLFATLVIAATVLGGVGSSLAQSEGGGSGLQVSPTRVNLSMLPGENKDFSYTVKNVTQNTVTVRMVFNDFESNGFSGDPQIITDLNRQLPNSLRDYIEGLADVQLASGESKLIELSVSLPSDLPAGGYYGVVRFSAVPQSAVDNTGDTPQVSLTASVAPLLLVEVAGDVVEQVQINSVEVLRGDSSKSVFFAAPDTVAIAVTNKGNNFARPFGRISVMRSGTEVYSYELNNTEPRGIILPNSSRTFTDEIQNINSFGRYTVVASVSAAQGGEVITLETSFWYIPMWVLLTAGAVITALVGGAYITFKRIGKRQRRRR